MICNVPRGFFFCLCLSFVPSLNSPLIFFRWRAYYNALKWLQSSDVKNSDVIVLMNKIELDMWSCCLQGNNPLVFVSCAISLILSPLSKCFELNIVNFVTSVR